MTPGSERVVARSVELESIREAVVSGTGDLRENVLVGVGGAPVTKEFADRIGADFYADDTRGGVLTTG